MARIEPVEGTSTRPQGTYEVRPSEQIAQVAEAPGVVFLIYTSTALAECKYNVTQTAGVGSPAIVVEDEPAGDSWQANPDVARALANVIAFRPELEDPDDEDLNNHGPAVQR
jgi:hypothetical protein